MNCQCIRVCRFWITTFWFWWGSSCSCCCKRW